MLKKIGVALASLLGAGFLVATNTRRIELWMSRGEFKRIIAAVENEVKEPNARGSFSWSGQSLLPAPHGKISGARDAKGRLVVRIDQTGGGFSTARGFLYTSDPSITLATQGGLIGFPEGIAMKRIDDQWATYYSTEE